MILKQTADLNQKPKRIISLVPSQTALLAHWELTNEVVGITKFCIHPTVWHTEKEKIGGTKNINIPKIISLQPDLIIANKEENVQSQVELLAKDFPVWVTDVNDLSGALDMIQDLGHLVKKEQAALNLIEDIHTQFEQLKQLENLLRVCYLIWKDPFMTVGKDTFIHDMLQTAGYKNAFDNCNRYPEVSITEIASAKPDVIFLSSEPYPFSNKHIQELNQYFQNIPIVLVDGEKFSWYGSHLLQSPAYFNALLQIIVDKHA